LLILRNVTLSLPKRNGTSHMQCGTCATTTFTHFFRMGDARLAEKLAQTLPSPCSYEYACKRLEAFSTESPARIVALLWAYGINVREPEEVGEARLVARLPLIAADLKFFLGRRRGAQEARDVLDELEPTLSEEHVTKVLRLAGIKER
jgi:hypothetical protein